MTKNRMENLSREVVGEGAVKIIDYLLGKKDISEFQVAKSLRSEVNGIRSLLYKLHNHNLVTYIRKKDKEKGWYISYWTLFPKGFKELESRLKRQKIETLKERLRKEESNKNSFFMCRNACIRMDIDQGMECNFRCPECGELLQQQDNTKTITNLKEKIKDMETEA